MSDAEPTPENADSTNRFKRAILRRLAILYVFFILYVLSIGPMFWRLHGAYYVETDRLSSRILVAFYEPLRYLCKIPFVGNAVDNYVEWWSIRSDS